MLGFKYLSDIKIGENDAVFLLRSPFADSVRPYYVGSERQMRPVFFEHSYRNKANALSGFHGGFEVRRRKPVPKVRKLSGL